MTGRRIPPLALVALVVVALLAAAGQAFAQAASAGLEGVIGDTSGGVLPGAAVSVRHVETNQSRETVTDGNGLFRLTLLPVGEYELRVTFPGLAGYVRQGLLLAVGQTVRLTIDLAPASVTDTVTVKPDTPLLDPTQTSVATAIDTERIEELPIRSRDYLQFTLLAPGVASAPPRAAVPGATPLAGSGFTFGGIRPRANRLFIDGVENDDAYSGGSRTELSLEIVREFQVVTTGYSAESGGASGGSINVITKTGANTIHGDAFVFGQGGMFNARPFFEETGAARPGLRRVRAGGAVGGPIVKDRTFYYFAAEREYQRADDASDIDPADAAAINDTLGKPGYAGLPTQKLRTGLFSTSRRETEASGKIVHRLSAGQSLMARYAFTANREAGDAFNTGGLVDWSGRGTTDVVDHALVGSLVSIVGPTATNDARWQVSSRRADLSTNQAEGPEIQIVGVADFGRPYTGNSNRWERHYDAADTVTVNAGRHLFKAGGSVERITVDSTSRDGFGGIYLFRDLAAFQAGQTDDFRQVFGDPSTSLATTRLAAFVQDRWTPAAHLTVDAGVRLD